DLSALTVEEFAAQLGRPDGEIGLAVSNMLNRNNGDLTRAVIRRLGLEPGERVLEIGFGNGKLTPELLAEASDLSYVGIDVAETMVAVARESNAEAIAAGRAAFHLASAEAMPVRAAEIDKILAVNVFYFIPDEAKAVREMRRALRPGGLSIIAGITPETAVHLSFARPEFGFRVGDLDALVAMHRASGFSAVAVEAFSDHVVMPEGTTRRRDYHLIVGRA
ncbi:MAG: class I SAM-dependent methyltransferase, partial [Ancalomicrobiaceae bacterium]|nr:class I SAM-dependent methyltransferase [Ancalomicrobiaceae bacterium]